MKEQNRWEGLFDDFLDITEFTLVKHKSEKTNKDEYDDFQDGVWGVYDNQGANLGNIEGDRFENAKDIFDRMDVYINDYFFTDLEEELEVYDVDLEEHDMPLSAYDWLNLRDDVKFCNKNKKFFDNHSFELDVLDMIANHAKEINLENCSYEED